MSLTDRARGRWAIVMFAVTVAAMVASALLAAPIEDHPRLEHASHFELGLAKAAMVLAGIAIVGAGVLAIIG